MLLMENPTKILSDEHQNILKVINTLIRECDALESEKGLDKAFFEKAIDFIRNYADKYHHAKEEGVIFQWLTNPIRVMGNEEGWVCALECQPQKLGPPDVSGRARPIPTDDPPVVIPIETLVIAVGTRPNRLLTKDGGLKTASWGGLVVNEESGATSRLGVYAGGDAVTGAATVILAAGAGLRAAAAIHAKLSASGNGRKGGG